MSNRASRMVTLALRAKIDENKAHQKIIIPEKDVDFQSVTTNEPNHLIEVPHTLTQKKIFEPIESGDRESLITLDPMVNVDPIVDVDPIADVDPIGVLTKVLPCNSGIQQNYLRDMPVITSENEMEESCDDSIADPNFSVSNLSSTTESDSDIANENIMEIQESAIVAQNNPGTVQNLQEIHATVLESKETPKLRKRKRNSGKAYTTATGKYVKAREVQLLNPCVRNCSNKLPPELQEQIFMQYWNVGNFNIRMAFVAGLIDIQEKKRTSNIRSTTAPRNRQFSYCYHLNIKGIRTQVCQKCFKATLGETDRFLKTVISKKLDSSGTTIVSDLRGKGPSARKISEDKYKEVVDHVKSFPAYESHYSRRHTSKLYLNSNLCLSKMYSLYVEEKTQPVSLSKYSEIFRTLGLKFKKPQLDSCTKCDLFKMKIQAAEGIELQNLLKEQTDHHQMAEQAYNSKKMDIAAISSTSKVFTFDLQQYLPTPFLRSSICYYKRQLYTFNLTIHDCGTGIPFCYMWHEAIGKRGGNEIASCLHEHLKTLPPTVRNITFYSDSCTGQNKNSYVALMFAIYTASSSSIESIDHKFLEPGHTHMECDADHSLIERKKKRTTIPIHHPRDWYQFIRSVGGKRTFQVHEMQQSDFKDYGLIAKTKCSFRKINENNDRIVWQNIKWLHYSKNFGKIYYKNSLDVDAPFEIMNIRKRGFNNLTNSEIPNCYNGPIKINEEKKKDLLSMLNLIDRSFHSFYLELCGESMPEYHPDITEEDNEEE